MLYVQCAIETSQKREEDWKAKPVINSTEISNAGAKFQSWCRLPEHKLLICAIYDWFSQARFIDADPMSNAPSERVKKRQKSISETNAGIMSTEI